MSRTALPPFVAREPTHSAGHNRETLPNHVRDAVAIRHGHHLKAEAAMSEIVEVARDDALREIS